MSVLRDAMSHAALGWVKPELDETLRQVRNEVEYFVEDPSDDSRMRFCAGYLHQVQGTLRMVELYAPAMVAEELELLADAVRAGRVPDRDEACATLMRGSILLPDYLERLQNGHRDIPIVLLPLLNEIRAACGEQGINESVLLAFDPEAANASEAELDHARGSLSGRNRELLDTVGSAVKEELLRVKDALDLHMRTSSDPAQLQTQVNELNAVADTLGMLGLGVARGVVVQQRDALRDVVSGGQAVGETLLLDIAGALLYVDASLDDQVAHLGANVGGNDEASSLETRRTVEVLAHEAIANFASARESFVAFIETNWDHQRLLGVPRLLGEVAGALRILDLQLPADYLTGVRQYIEIELIGRQRIPSGRQLDTLADAMASLEYYLEALRDRRPGREDILDITRSSLEALRYWPLSDPAITPQDSTPVSPDAQPQAAAVGGQRDDVPATVLTEAESPSTPITPAAIDVAPHAPEKVDGAARPYTLVFEKAVSPFVPESISGLEGTSPPTVDLESTLSEASIDSSAFDPVFAEESIAAEGDYSIAPLDLSGDGTTFDDAVVSAFEAAPRESNESPFSIAPEDTGTITLGAGTSTFNRGLLELDEVAPETRVAGPGGIATDAEVTDAALTESAFELSLAEERALAQGLSSSQAFSADGSVDLIEPHTDDSVSLVEAAFADRQEDADIAIFMTELDAAAAGFYPDVEPSVLMNGAAAIVVSDEAAAAPVLSGGFEDGGDEIDQDIRDVFIEEFDEELINLGKLLPIWRAAPGNMDRLRPLRRIFHTLKGSGRLVGARLLGEFSWKIESMLNRVLDGSRPASPAVVNMVTQAYEVLPELNAALCGKGQIRSDLVAMQAVAGRIAAGEEAFYIVSVAPVETPAAAESVAPMQGTPASIDSVLLEILKVEIAAHLATVHEWLAESQLLQQPVSEDLLRAVHTMSGAFAMTDVPEITAVTVPTETFVKRSLTAAVTPSQAGVAAVSDTASAIAATITALQTPSPLIPSFAELAARMQRLADALPEVKWPPVSDEETIEFEAFDERGDVPTTLEAVADSKAAPSFDEIVDSEFVPELQNIGMIAAESDVVEAACDEAGTEVEVKLESQGHIAPLAEAESATAAVAVDQEDDSSPASILARIDDLTDSQAFEAAHVPTAAVESTELVEKLDAALPVSGEEQLLVAVSDQEVLEQHQQTPNVAGSSSQALADVVDAVEHPVSLDHAGVMLETADDVIIDHSSSNAASARADQIDAGIATILVLDASAVEVDDHSHAAVSIDESIASEAVQTTAHTGAPSTFDDSDLVVNPTLLDAVKPGATAAAAVVDGALDFRELDQDLVDIFVEEGIDLLDHCDGLINELRAAPEDRDALAGLQRDLHTLKGGARMAGINAIGDLGHGIESLLEAVAAHRTELSRNDVHLLERGFDRLHQLLSETGKHRVVAMPYDLIEVFDLRTSGQNGVSVTDHDGSAAHTPEPESFAALTPASADAQALAQPATAVAPRTLTSDPMAPLSEPVAEVTATDDDGTGRGQEQVRVRSDLLDRLVNHAGEVAIYRSRLEQQLGAFRGAMAELDRTNARLRDQLRRLDLETEAQIVARYRREQEQVDQTFDPLELDRFSTLQQLSRALNESAADLGGLQGVLEDLSRNYDSLLQQQSRVSSELQDGLMRARMVPFDGLVPRLRRVVRQAAQDTGKQVHLTLEGTHGELDRNVLERMVAPLEHMLRNSVAHGLETPERRVAAGKPEEGGIVLKLRREGSEIVLEVADDGAGLDRYAIRRRAEQRGLIAVGAPISDSELDNLIFASGFSTSEQVSQLAGRGVGMDVVRNEVRQLGGSIDIDSVPEHGVTFTLRLPQTLAVTQAVFVQIGETTFAVPVASVSGIGRIARERFESDEGSYHYNGEDFALHDLGTLVGQAAAKAEEQSQVPLLLVRAGDLRVAVAIDQVLGNREIVVKPVGLQIASVPGIYGATITGDGNVVVILDVAPLVRRHLAQPQVPKISVAPVRQRQVPMVMVVDDSLTMRKVTGRVLERHNFEVVVARDGIEALERLEERVPDLMLLDIEMPRMDGYELATAMRADPRFKGIPIVMITSRSGDKHRQRAFEIGVQRYLGKPYQELDLMRNVYDLLGIARVRQ